MGATIKNAVAASNKTVRLMDFFILTSICGVIALYAYVASRSFKEMLSYIDQWGEQVIEITFYHYSGYN